MKKAKNHYYVVWRGLKPGIYDSWEQCRKQVEGFEAARYMGFPTLEAAVNAFKSNPEQVTKKRLALNPDPLVRTAVGHPIKESICVDAACSGNPGILEYRGVYLPTGEEIFHRGPFAEGTTNIGEFLAIVTGLAWLQQKKSTIPVYSDSRNGIIWIKQKRINTKLVRSSKNGDLFSVVDKALEWLHNNTYENPVLKWETSVWGEIPADFGRK